MNKKFLNVALAVCMTVPCAVAFVGCGMQKANFEFADAVSSSTQTIIEDLTNNYYNASTLGNSTKYSVAQIKELDSDFVYYVELGEVSNVDKVESISMGSTKFTGDQTFSLSIGNANTIEDKCYYLEENTLFVAAPIVAFESANDGKLKINDTEFKFESENEITEGTFDNALFSAGSTNTITKNEDGTYEATFKDAKTYLAFYYEGAIASDVVLTKKVVTNSGSESLNNKVNYGLTKVENYEGYPLGFYPIGYSADALTENFVTTYDGATMNYEAYVIGKGLFKAKINYNVETSAE